MSMIPLKKVFRARYLIKAGYSVAQVAKELKVSQTWVRSYTKSEREYAKSQASYG